MPILALLPFLFNYEKTRMLAHRNAEDSGFAAMLAAKRCRTRGESTPLLCVAKAAHSGFETQSRHHQRTRAGVSVVP